MPGTNPFLPPAPLTDDQKKAQDLANMVIRQTVDGQRLLQQLVASIKKQWSDLWENTEFTAAQVLAAYGTTAAERFRVAGVITAAVYAIDSSLLDAKYLSAKQAYTAHPDGTVTLN